MSHILLIVGLLCGIEDNKKVDACKFASIGGATDAIIDICGRDSRSEKAWDCRLQIVNCMVDTDGKIPVKKFLKCSGL